MAKHFNAGSVLTFSNSFKFESLARNLILMQREKKTRKWPSHVNVEGLAHPFLCISQEHQVTRKQQQQQQPQLYSSLI